MTSINNNDNKCDQVANFLTKLRKIDPDGSLYMQFFHSGYKSELSYIVAPSL